MTIDRVKRDLKDAVSEAEDYIDDLHSRVEDLEAENQRLAGQLDTANDDVSYLQGENARLEDRLATLLAKTKELLERVYGKVAAEKQVKAPGLRPEER